MSGRLTADDIEVLTGLVRAEVNRVVEQRVGELRAAVSQALIDLAVNQLKYLGVELTPMERPADASESMSNGQ